MKQSERHVITDKKPYRVELFQEKTIADFIKCVREIFNKEYSEEYVQWKYFSNPLNKNLSLVLYKNNSMIGFKGCIPMRYNIEGTSFYGAGEEDNFLLAEHRSIHLYLWFSKVFHNYLYQNKIFFITGFPNENAVQIVKLDPNNFKVADKPLHIRYHNVSKVLRKRVSSQLLARFAAFFLNIFLHVLHFSFIRIPPDAEVEVLYSCDDRFNTFWKAISDDYGIFGVRNASFLNWRYLHTPFVKGKIICLKEKMTSDIICYAVIGETKENNKKVGNVYELIAPKETSPNYVEALLKTAIQLLEKDNVDTINAWIVNEMHTYNVFIKYGFLQRGKDWEGVYVHKTDSKDKKLDINLLKNVSNWYFSRSDMYFH